MDKLEEVEARLEQLEANLNFYGSQILTEEERPSHLQDRLFYSPSRSELNFQYHHEISVEAYKLFKSEIKFMLKLQKKI